MKFLKIMSECLLFCQGLFIRPAPIKPESAVNRIPFDFIAENLRKVVRASSDVIGRKVIVPNTFIVKFSLEDRAARRHVEPILIEELRLVAQKEIGRIKGVVPDNNLTINLDSDEHIETGHFYIDCLYIEQKKPVKKLKQPAKKQKITPELSETFVPPSESPEMKSGAFIKTLLNPVANARIDCGRPAVFCKVTIRDSRCFRTVYLAGGRYVFGRGADADIQLDPLDMKISRRHLSLIIENEGITVCMIGKNGGRINGESIAPGIECFANSGDSVSIGNTELTFELENSQDLE